MLTMRISYVSFKHPGILWDVKPNPQLIRTKLLTSQKCFQILSGYLVNSMYMYHAFLLTKDKIIEIYEGRG